MDGFNPDSRLPTIGDQPTDIVLGKPLSSAADGQMGMPPQLSEGLKLIEKLGTGGFGVVYRARENSLDREVAVKFLRAADCSADERARFQIEAVITGNLQHPNIVPVYSSGRASDGRDFFTMRVIAGCTLADSLSALRKNLAEVGAKWPLPRLIRILVTVCEAVGYAHARGVVHRDLKPANIMLGDFGEVSVLDWGLAKLVNLPDPVIASAQPERSAAEGWFRNRLEECSSGQTMDGTIVGTPGYLSPEQASGDIASVGPASDVYSLGVILYEMLCLRLPTGKGSGKEAIQRTSLGTLDIPSAPAGRPLPRALAAVANKALTLNWAARYGDANRLAEDLRAWLDDRPLSVYRPGLGERLATWMVRLRTLAAAERQVQATLEHNLASETAQRAALARRAQAFALYSDVERTIGRASAVKRFASEAEDKLNRALELDPQLAVALTARARMRELLERPKEALEDWLAADRAVRIAGGRPVPDALVSAARLCLLKLNDGTRSRALFAEAAKAGVEHPLARMAAAFLRYLEGETTAALADLERLAIEQPDWAEIHESIGLICIGWMPETALSHSGGPGAHRDPLRALMAFTAAIVLDPGDSKMHMLRAMAALMAHAAAEQGRPDLLDEAMREYDVAIILSPKYTAARHRRMELQYARNQLEAAWSESEMLLGISGPSADLDFWQARIRAKQGRIDEAKDLYRSSLSRKPGFKSAAAEKAVRDEFAALS